MGTVYRLIQSALLGLWVISAILLVGCASAQPHKSAQPHEAAPHPRQKRPQSTLETGIWDVTTGARLERDEFFDRLAGYRWVVIGEHHDNPWHHRAQEKIYRALIARHSGPVALGMEMFQRPYQPALDAYTSGTYSEEKMLERTDYAFRWGLDPLYYQSIWRLAAEHGQPIVALNARSELSRKVAEVGLEGLPAAFQADVPSQMNLSNQAHRAYVREAFQAHDMQMDEASFERFYQAQVLWDETMSETAVEFMKNRPDLQAMVILAGAAHAHAGFGIPPRIIRRVGSSRDAVVSVLPVSAGSAQAPESLAQLRKDHAADYVWVN